MTFDIRNPRWSGEDMIDVEWNHPTLGQITYTAVDGSGEPEMQAIWDAVTSGEYGAIGAAVELLARDREGMVVSRFQAKAALMQAGLLEAAEAAVAQADPVMQLAWAEAVGFRRASPAIAAIGAALNLTDEDIDELFDIAAGIEA